MKISLILKIFIASIFIYFFYQIFLFLYEVFSPYPIIEIKRWSNSKKSIDTVLALRETGATDLTPYYIYLIPKDKEIIKNDTPVLHITDIKSVNNIEILWLDENKLIIKINNAIIHSFYGYTYLNINNEKKLIYINLIVDHFYK
jgi:hypothetical protein